MAVNAAAVRSREPIQFQGDSGPLKTGFELFKGDIAVGLDALPGEALTDKFLSRRDEINLFDEMRALKAEAINLEKSGLGKSKRCKRIRQKYVALRNSLVLSKGFLAVTIAGPFCDKKDENLLMDLISEVLDVFLKVSEFPRFDPREYSFSAYAGRSAVRYLGQMLTARKSVLHYTHQTKAVVDGPLLKQQNIFPGDSRLSPERVHKTTKQLYPEMKDKEKRLDRLNRALALQNEDRKSFDDNYFINHKTQEPWEIAVEREALRIEEAKRQTLHAAIKRLSKVKAYIIRERLSGRELETIGHDLRCTRENVRMHEKRGKEKLKQIALDPTSALRLRPETPEFEKAAASIYLPDFAKRRRLVVSTAAKDPAAFHRTQLEFAEYYPKDADLVRRRYPAEGKPQGALSTAKQLRILPANLDHRERIAFRRFKLLLESIQSSRDWDGKPYHE